MGQRRERDVHAEVRNSRKRGKPWLGGDDGIKWGRESIGGVRAVETFDGRFW
jgi:hypothetical protein